MEKISHSKLCELIHYDPDTGIFRWRTRRPKIRPGQIAGGLHGKGYIYIEIFGKSYAAHRLAWFYMTGEWPLKQVDHENREKSDNRWNNLRAATHGQNRANSKHTNKTGFKGVCFKHWLKEKPYAAQITFNKKVIYLGCYPTPEEAHAAYIEAAIRLHGEFANP